jgi:TRAP-type mannitol/chloroaromatic compound transport system permease large subunit
MLEPSTWALVMVAAFFGMLMVGIPVAVSMATVGFVFGYIGFGDSLFNLLPARVYGVVGGYQWMAIPLLVFMGVMLEKSRLADDLLDVMGHVAGGLRGGMGIGIVLFGVLMGATTGIVGATIITLGLLTLPTLIRRGYDTSVACGTICASGTLGQIIPPSLILILLGDIMQLSVGTLFAAAVVPGMLLAAVYVIYLLVLGWLRPQLMPPIPLDERSRISRGELAGRLFRVVLPPIGLVVAVLGSIVGGVAAQVFALAFRGLNGEDVITRLFEWLPGGVNADIVFMMALIFVLGFFIEWIEISYIAVPLFLPVLLAQGVDPVWLAILVTVNLQSSFLTPPFGWALFYLKGVAPRRSRLPTSTGGWSPSSCCSCSCW